MVIAIEIRFLLSDRNLFYFEHRERVVVQQLALIFLFGNYIFHFFFVVLCPRQQQQQKSEKCQANKLYCITYNVIMKIRWR